MTFMRQGFYANYNSKKNKQTKLTQNKNVDYPYLV